MKAQGGIELLPKIGLLCLKPLLLPRTSGSNVFPTTLSHEGAVKLHFTVLCAHSLGQIGKPNVSATPRYFIRQKPVRSATTVINQYAVVPEFSVIMDATESLDVEDVAPPVIYNFSKHGWLWVR